MKMTDDPRKVMLDSVGIRQGQIITSLNASLPKIDKLPDFLYNLMNGTLPQFYNYFSDVDGITKLNTPEKVANFTLDYDTIGRELIGKKFTGTVDEDSYTKEIKVPNADGTFSTQEEIKVSYKVTAFEPVQ